MSPSKRTSGRKPRELKYFATYIGKQKDIKLSPGVGKIIRGKEFEVTLEMYNALRQDRKNFRVSSRLVYI